MLKFLNTFVVAGVALFFSQNVFAVIKAEVPKSVKQGGVIKVIITAPSVEPHEAHFYPVGWPADKNGAKKDGMKVDAIVISGGKQIALIPISVSEEPGIGLISVFSRHEGYSFAIEIKKVDFPESKRVFFIAKPTPKMLRRSQEERAFLDKIYALITPRKYFAENLRFENPLEIMEMVPNADFGQIRKKALVNSKTRKIENRWKDYHKGSDFRASIGTLVFAAKAGKVVAARNLLGSGNTIIIDHGYGLISLYFHLSKIQVHVREGVDVLRGDWIGLAGMSGNAEGPHLHFEVRLYGVPVNPFEFLQATSHAELQRSRGGAK